MVAMKQTTTTVRLANGEALTIRVLEPPLGDYAERIEYWWRDIREPLVAGDLAETSLDRFIVGELQGEYVGSMTYATARRRSEVAVLGMVWTRPDQRRKGIATQLLRQTIADFRALGGMAMYLCTTNPNAYALYHKQGFRPLIGDGMRYLAPGCEDFDRTYFAHDGPASIRPGTWGDLAPVSSLYNQPQPDWFIKDYPRRVFRDIRYEGHYRRVWLPTQERQGAVLVLENRRQRVVGIASTVAVDSYVEQHTHVVDCWACPAYLAQLPELLSAVVERTRAAGAETLQAHLAEGDRAKQQIFQEAGFREEARLTDRLRVDAEPAGRQDLCVYHLSLDGRASPAHPASGFYGARPAFQSRR